MFLIVIACPVSMHLTALVLITTITRINSSRVHLDYMPHRTTFKIPFLTHSALSTTLAAWKAPKWACLGLWCFFHCYCFCSCSPALMPSMEAHLHPAFVLLAKHLSCKLLGPCFFYLMHIDATHCKQKRGEAGRFHAEMGWTVGKASFKSPFLAYLPHGPSFQWRPSCMFQNATFAVFGCADHAFKSH